MHEKAVTAIAFLVGSLLAIVVVIGLAQKTLDSTGVAVALCSVLTGIVGGALLRSRTPKDGGE